MDEDRETSAADAAQRPTPEWEGSVAPEPHGPSVTDEAVQGPAGNDNIAEGRVAGLMGGPLGTQGQGQGG